MTTIERLRALLAEATPGPWVVDDTTDQFEDYMAEEERGIKTGWFRGGVGQVDTGDFSTLTLADATIAVEAVNRFGAHLDLEDAALAYLASDGSGIRAEGRWSAPFDALDHAKALGRLRAALARLDGAS